MDTRSPSSFAQQTSLRSYGADRWGEGFLSVNQHGQLEYSAPGLPPVDLHAAAERLRIAGVSTPFVLRFPSVIENQMARMRRAFEAAREEYRYTGDYIGLYPLKVNPRRAVVDTVCRVRRKLGFGLEAGSKPELLVAAMQEPVQGGPVVINGFKDREFIRMAFHAAELGHEVIIVFESLHEVRRYIDVASERAWRSAPSVGVRAKLHARGSGRWQSSGGESSKFGLSANEILMVARELEAAGLLERLNLLHFHIGSQITRIVRIKQAVREAARVYVTLGDAAPYMKYLDLGGGIGVDYDGSRTSYPSSANYTVEEYASQVVYEVSEIVREAGVKPPTLLTESGRYLVAQHAVTVSDMREVQGELLPLPERHDDEHRVILALREGFESISPKNYEEYVHDAMDLREEALTLFAAGYLSLHERASAEALFARIRAKAQAIMSQLTKPSEEIADFLDRAHHKYLINVSIFQSIPDAWSIEQVFPAAPLSRHGERPSFHAQLVDITCDSDGCLKTFAHPDENLRYLPLHQRRSPDERYYLGFFMTGAYQDSLANMHNLFARCHEIVVCPSSAPRTEPAGTEIVQLSEGVDFRIVRGLGIGEVVDVMGFDKEMVAGLLRARHAEAQTSQGEGWSDEVLRSYPYLTS